METSVKNSQSVDNILLVLDFDLTLFKSYEFTDFFYLYLQDELGLDLSKLPKYVSGQSTDVLRQVEEIFVIQFDIKELSAELTRYIFNIHNRTPESFMYPDALNLLAYTRQHANIAPLIMTKGGMGYQGLKLCFATDLVSGIPYFIQDLTTHKADEVVTELLVEDHFEAVYPDRVVVADTLLLIDDKPADLVGLPPHATGIFIPRNPTRAEQDMDVMNTAIADGHDVIAVATLDDVVTMLQNREK
jgi:hypothetical protein